MSRALHQVPAARRIQTANSGWYKRRLCGTGVNTCNEGRHDRGGLVAQCCNYDGTGDGNEGRRLSRWMMRERRNTM